MMGLHRCNNTISVSVIFCALVSYHSFSLLQFNSPWRKKNFQLIQGGSSYSKYWFTNTGWLNLSSWYSFHLPVSFLAPFLEVGSLLQGQLNWHTELLWSTRVHCLAGWEGRCPCRVAWRGRAGNFSGLKADSHAVHLPMKPEVATSRKRTGRQLKK